MPLKLVLRRRPASRRRKLLYGALGLLVVLLIAAFAIPYLAVNRYRGQVETIVSEFIDRPTSIGRLSATLAPGTTLTAHDVSIGHPEFNVVADRVIISVALAPLTRRIVKIDSICVEGLVWTIPESPGDLADEIQALEFNTSGEESPWEAVIDLAYTRDARIVVAGHDTPALAGNFDVTNLLSNEIGLDVEAVALAAGENARLSGDVTFRLVKDAEPSLQLAGNATLENVMSREFVDERVVPNTEMDFSSIAFKRTGADRVEIDLSGESFPSSREAAEAAALTGAFTAKAIWEDGATTIDIAEWRADGFQFTGTIGVDKEGGTAIAIDNGLANADGIDAYFALRPLADYDVAPRQDAAFSVVNLKLGRSPDGVIQLQDGAIEFSGLDLLVEVGKAAFNDFHGSVAVGENRITLHEIAGEGIKFAGEIQPDFEAQTYAFALNAEAQLTRERLEGFMDVASLTEAAGAITIASARGTITSEGGVPEDLALEGALTQGKFVYASEDFDDTLDTVDVRFTAEPGRITTTGSATSQMLGAVSVDGAYATEERAWTGTVASDVSNVSLPGLEGRTQEVVANILGRYGRSDVRVAFAVPADEAFPATLTLERLGETPRLAATLAFPRDEEWALGDVNVTANISSRVIAPLLPESLHATGPIDVVFRRSLGEQRFRADLDFRQASVSMGEYIEKQPGGPLTVAVEGSATDDRWAADTFNATLFTESIAGTVVDDRVAIPAVDLNVAALAPLLREGGQASGRVTGSLNTDPTAVALELVDVRLALSDDLVIERINGPFRITDDGFMADNLEVNAANSSFAVTARQTEGGYTGSLTGSTMDANALAELYEAFASLDEDELTAVTEEAGQSMLAAEGEEAVGGSLLAGAPESKPDFSEPIAGGEEPAPFEGTFDVKIDSLLYRNATFSNLSTTVVAAGGNVSAQNLTFTPSSGQASGKIEYLRGDATRGNRLVADLVLGEADAAFIDGLAFEEPQNLRGLISGNVYLDMPIADAGVELSGLNGKITFNAANGSLGSLGFANAILFVFRSTEILFLRSPFGDGGLSFDQMAGQATIDNGVITLGVQEGEDYTEAIVLERPSYRMSAIGKIDLPQWQSDVFVHMKPLSTVTDAATIFKLDQVKAINERGGLRIAMTGPPDDPKTQVGLGEPVRRITGDVRSSVQSVGNIVKDEIIKGLGGLIRDVLE
jgi:hypothetical protein